MSTRSRGSAATRSRGVPRFAWSKKLAAAHDWLARRLEGGGISPHQTSTPVPEHHETGAAVLTRGLERLMTPTREDPQ